MDTDSLNYFYIILEDIKFYTSQNYPRSLMLLSNREDSISEFTIKLYLIL